MPTGTNYPHVQNTSVQCTHLIMLSQGLSVLADRSTVGRLLVEDNLKVNSFPTSTTALNHHSINENKINEIHFTAVATLQGGMYGTECEEIPEIKHQPLEAIRHVGYDDDSPSVVH